MLKYCIYYKNYFKQLYFKVFLILLLMLSGNISLAHQLPDMGDPSVSSLTKAEEIEISEKYFEEIKQAGLIVNNEYLNEYAQNLGTKLVHHTENRDKFNYRFYIIEDKDINAFALPSGIICIHTGLILATENESELAAILAHEVTHVSQKHIARIHSRLDKIKVVGILGLAAAALIGSKNLEAGSLALYSTIGGTRQTLLNYTRWNEQEADSLGMEKLEAAGFDVNAMPAFLEKMKIKYLHENVKPPEYLLTHPLTENRVTKARARAQQYSYKQVPSSTGYHIVKAYIKQKQFNYDKESLEYFMGNNSKNEIERKTGLALAYKDNLKYKEAAQLFKELSNSFPNKYFYKLELAQTLEMLGKTDEAKTVLWEAHLEHPSNINIVKRYCNLLISTNLDEDARTAIKIVRKMKNIDNPEFHEIKVKAYKTLNNPFYANLSESDYLTSSGRLYGALHKLKLLMRDVKKDSKEESLVKHKIEQVSQLIKENYYSEDPN